jgi:hypothetical protein
MTKGIVDNLVDQILKITPIVDVGFEPSLKDIITVFYGKYFDKDGADKFASEYISRLKKEIRNGG